MKQVLIILGCVVLAGGAFWALALYMTLRTRVADLSGQAPFAGLVGQDLTLVRDVQIALNYKHFVHEHPYLLAEAGEELYSEVTGAEVLPAGSALRVTGTKSFTNGTSGFATLVVLGTTRLPSSGESVPFEYSWGEYHFRMEPEESCWTFGPPPWGDAAVEGEFRF